MGPDILTNSLGTTGLFLASDLWGRGYIFDKSKPEPKTSLNISRLIDDEDKLSDLQVKRLLLTKIAYFNRMGHPERSITVQPTTLSLLNANDPRKLNVYKMISSDNKKMMATRWKMVEAEPVIRRLIISSLMTIFILELVAELEEIGGSCREFFKSKDQVILCQEEKYKKQGSAKLYKDLVQRRKLIVRRGF